MDLIWGGAPLSFWLGVLGVMELFIAPPTVIGIWLGRKKPPLGRNDYVMACLIIMATLIIITKVGLALRTEHRTMPTAYIWPFLQYACVRRLMQRLRDAALSPHLAWLAVMPVVNVILFLAACLPPSRPVARTA